jgi:hypothetical protein
MKMNFEGYFAKERIVAHCSMHQIIFFGEWTLEDLHHKKD